MGQQNSAVRVEPYGSSGWQKALVHLHATHELRPRQFVRHNIGQWESAAPVELVYIWICLLCYYQYWKEGYLNKQLPLASPGIP
jgi:hypothetical protein